MKKLILILFLLIIVLKGFGQNYSDRKQELEDSLNVMVSKLERYMQEQQRSKKLTSLEIKQIEDSINILEKKFIDFQNYAINELTKYNKIKRNDSIEIWTVDDYPITDSMIRGKNHIGICENIIAADKVWFSNKTNQEVLIFDLYTDFFRISIYHFESNLIPKGIIDKIDMGAEEDFSKMASFEQKKKCILSFIDSSTIIDEKYFTSHKGVQLGDVKKKCLSIYNSPDSISSSNGIERLEWKFDPDWKNWDGEYDLEFKRVGKDKFGHQTIMYFKGERLIGVILHNDIP